VLGSGNLRLDEVTAAAEEIRASADPGATVIFGAGLDKKLGDTIQITVIATGFDLSDEPAGSTAATAPRMADEPSPRYDGVVDRRAPVDLEAPSYIRRGRRSGDLPLDTPAPATAEANADPSTSEERAPEAAGNRPRRK
jgi:hypothetical protein